MSIDWNTAPEGATHYAPKLEENDFWCSVFWRMENGVGVEAWNIDNRTGELHHFNRPTWIETTAKRLVPRPVACAHASTTWDGQGLPPVGTVCIVYPHNTQWGFNSTAGHERKVLAYHGDFVWLGTENEALEATRTDKVDFEAIHSPEQIAAEEREKAISEMLDLYNSAYWPMTSKQFCEVLFDAGYRRQEEGK